LKQAPTAAGWGRQHPRLPKNLISCILYFSRRDDFVILQFIWLLFFYKKRLVIFNISTGIKGEKNVIGEGIEMYQSGHLDGFNSRSYHRPGRLRNAQNLHRYPCKSFGGGYHHPRPNPCSKLHPDTGGANRFLQSIRG
jgi:hypothetical protein